MDAKKRLVLPLEIRCQLSDPESDLILLSVKRAKDGQCELLMSSAKPDAKSGFVPCSKNVKTKTEV